jgi:hypothetical protein
MKNITLSITDFQRRRIRIWAARRQCSAPFIVRRFLEDPPKVGRAHQAINSSELDRLGIRPTLEKPGPRRLLKTGLAK